MSDYRVEHSNLKRHLVSMDGDQKKICKTISFPLNIVTGLDKTRTDAKLCDIKIVVGDKHVYAHKFILAIVSPFFDTMFTGELGEDEPPQTEVDMTDVFNTVDMAETVIKSLYSGTVEVSTSNVCQLIKAYDSLMIFSANEEIKEELLYFMKETVSVDTCLDYWALFPYNQCPNVGAMVTNLLRRRFHDYFVYQFDKIFQNFSLNDIRTLFQQDLFKFCGEWQILYFLSKWLLATGPSGLEEFQQLVKETRFPRSDHPKRAVEDFARRLRLGTFKDEVITKACGILWSEISQEATESDLVNVTKIPSSSEINNLSGSKEEWENEVSIGRILEAFDRNSAKVIIGVAWVNPQGNSDGENDFTVYAYLIESRLWLEIGSFILPETVCPRGFMPSRRLLRDEGEIFSVGPLFYILLDSDLFEINLLSHAVNIIKLPARGEFNRCFQDENNLYSLCEETMFPSRQKKVIVFRLSTCGQWETVLESDWLSFKQIEQCWADNGCVFVFLNSGENCSLLQISTSSAQPERLVSVTNCAKFCQRQNTLVLKHGHWYYIVENPPQIKVTMRLPRELLETCVQAEIPDDSFPALAEPVIEDWESERFIERTCFASCDSSLFLIKCGRAARSTFTESTLGAPAVVEHPPPPCDNILAISSGTLERSVLLTGKLARYTRRENQESHDYYLYYGNDYSYYGHYDYYDDMYPDTDESL